MSQKWGFSSDDTNKNRPQGGLVQIAGIMRYARRTWNYVAITELAVY